MSRQFNVRFASTGSTNGKSSVSIGVGDIDSSTSLTLPGDGKVDYGEFFNANILQILENFSNATTPNNPTIGQLWYNPGDFKLRVYVGTVGESGFFGSTNIDTLGSYVGWLTISTISGTPNSSPQCGELYFNTNDNNLYIWDCSTQPGHWIILGSNNFIKKDGTTTLTAPLTIVPGTVGNEAVTFTQLQAVDDRVTLVAQSSMPSGIIVMWSGSTVPTGWHLCDGTGTYGSNNDPIPDLRGKFILGASVSNPVNTTGGSTTLNLTRTDTHTLLETEIPSHTHSGFFGSTFSTFYPGGNGAPANNGTTTGATGGGQGHFHTISASTYMPPYYALAYIIKL